MYTDILRGSSHIAYPYKTVMDVAKKLVQDARQGIVSRSWLQQQINARVPRTWIGTLVRCAARRTTTATS